MTGFLRGDLIQTHGDQIGYGVAASFVWTKASGSRGVVTIVVVTNSTFLEETDIINKLQKREHKTTCHVGCVLDANVFCLVWLDLWLPCILGTFTDPRRTLQCSGRRRWSASLRGSEWGDPGAWGPSLYGGPRRNSCTGGICILRPVISKRLTGDPCEG